MVLAKRFENLELTMQKLECDLYHNVVHEHLSSYGYVFLAVGSIGCLEFVP